MKKIKYITKNDGFTLVELIVVITILAILGTIAFIALQGYSRDSRDSVRISDMGRMKTGLELFLLDAGKYPLPTDGDRITFSGALAWTQGYFGEEVFTNVNKLDKIPKDPKTDMQYVYSATNTRQEFQLGGTMEGGNLGILLKGVYASIEAPLLKINGTYNGRVLKVRKDNIDYVLAVPSIITSSGFTLENIIEKGTLAYDGYKNLPYQYDGVFKIDGEEKLNLVNSGSYVVFSGDISELSDGTGSGQEARAQLITDLKSAYIGTDIETVGQIAQILNTTETNEIEIISSAIVSNNLGGKIVASSSTTSGGEEEITGWRALDPNCDIDDIVLGTQTWAGCNSTLGDGFEYGQAVGDSVGEYNGTLDGTYGCYGYDSTVGNNNTECIFGSSMLSSSGSTKEYFEMKQGEGGTNSNGDSEFDTIWGKLYTWSNSSSACPTGRHVPSDEEWTTLTTYLNGGIICETTTGWQCEGLGWNGHNSKTDSNNLANALKIPLAGYRIIDGSTFTTRGHFTHLWSSTPISTTAYYRSLNLGNSAVYRYNNFQSYGFSVRCLKD